MGVLVILSLIPSPGSSTATTQAAASPNTGYCSTPACIIGDAKTMIGSVDKDESVLTK